MERVADIREFWRACARDGRYLFFAVALPLFLVSSFFRQKSLGAGGGSARERMDPRAPARAYLENMRHLDAICRSRGIRFAAVLQPYNGIGERPLTEADRVIVSAARRAPGPGGGSRLDFLSAYYAAIRARGKDEAFFADFTRVFDRVEGQVFFDNIHFSDRGQEIVGRALVELVKSREGEER